MQALVRELSNWPRLNEDNLHSFRLKVKELRSVLQLLADGDMKIMAARPKQKMRSGNGTIGMNWQLLLNEWPGGVTLVESISRCSSSQGRS